MRNEFAIGPWLAAGAAIFLSVAGCTVPLLQGKAANNHDIALASPSPSPSPSPSASIQPFGVTGPGFHAGEVGLVYTPVTYTATGGVAPYTWTVATGALPPGLTLNNGTVSGKPSGSGTYTATIEVVDSASNKFDVPVSITVASALSAGLISSCAKACNVELGCATVCGSFGTQTGGIGPFTYQLTQGQLPAGTSLSALSLVGTFTGLTGYLQFTVQVTDSLGATASLSPIFWMYPHISLASGGCSTAYGTPCQATLKISGGVPNDKFTVRVLADNMPGPNQGCGSYGPALPSYYGVSGSSVAINVPGNWPNSSGYGAIWTIQVTDTALCAPSTYCNSNQATAVVEVACG